MLQQTQVTRVLQIYPRFLERFPHVRSLGSAPRRDVITAWRGMGYNRRAVCLHELARAVVRNYGARIPSDPETLLSLPGVGRYTMHAIRAFAFGRRVPVVDVNVRRVLSRLFFRMPTRRSLLPESATWKLAAELLPGERVYDWNQALMDLGASVCTGAYPGCDRCPVARMCRSRPGMRSARAGPHRKEPSHAGVPNRIYRGRVVEMLRPGGARNAGAVGRRLVSRFGRRDHPWLAHLLLGLERDGLVRLTGRGTIVNRRVSLA